MNRVKSIAKKAWNFLITEPFVWIFRCFFQPAAFREETANLKFWKRFEMLQRLLIPLFLICYSFSIVTYAISFIIDPSMYNNLKIACNGDAILNYPSFKDSYIQYYIDQQIPEDAAKAQYDDLCSKSSINDIEHDAGFKATYISKYIEFHRNDGFFSLTDIITWNKTFSDTYLFFRLEFGDNEQQANDHYWTIVGRAENVANLDQFFADPAFKYGFIMSICGNLYYCDNLKSIVRSKSFQAGRDGLQASKIYDDTKFDELPFLLQAFSQKDFISDFQSYFLSNNIENLGTQGYITFINQLKTNLSASSLGNYLLGLLLMTFISILVSLLISFFFNLNYVIIFSLIATTSSNLTVSQDLQVAFLTPSVATSTLLIITVIIIIAVSVSTINKLDSRSKEMLSLTTNLITTIGFYIILIGIYFEILHTNVDYFWENIIIGMIPITIGLVIFIYKHRFIVLFSICSGLIFIFLSIITNHHNVFDEIVYEPFIPVISTIIIISLIIYFTVILLLPKILGVIISSLIIAILAVKSISTLKNNGLINQEKPIYAGVYLGAVLCVIVYLLCLYRFPTYIISNTSVWLAYKKSLKNSSDVFSNLQRSGLYWDEVIYFPLTSLVKLLLLAASQNQEKALKEINFIVTQHPQQIKAAREATLQILLADLNERITFSDISQASKSVNEIVPQESNVLDPRWQTAFIRLNEASQEASRYLNTHGLEAKRQALDSFEQSLKKMRSSATFSKNELSQQLAALTEKWLAVAEKERGKLENEVEEAGYLYNPYAPGNGLDLRPSENDNLFVGRRDIGDLIEEALSRGTQRPTFLLYGERRMGKTSALKQMPHLLGSRYLPIFCDLQNNSYRASIVGFLNNIAEQIYITMSRNGHPVKDLTIAKLREAEAKSDLAVYAVFDEWLKGVEKMLEKADRTIIITFDEFEKLEDEATQQAIKLELLLDWFRNIIQHRPRLALLFSGVKTFSEMGSGWSGYFVNVQNVKISFLKPDEAELLITKPLPDFQGDKIYSPEVVQEIIRVTGCQPLLVQAVCSDLIKLLNEEERERAEVADVAMAVEATLESWGSYFDDLWQRTTPGERACLEALLLQPQEMLPSDFKEIGNLTGLEAPAARQAVQKLTRRDILMEVKTEGYKLAIPMLKNWITQYSEKIL